LYFGKRQFQWEIYSERLLASLPAQCSAGRGIWTTVTQLIFVDVVEFHVPNRVVRQFGYRQEIPEPTLLLDAVEHRRLHRLTRIGRPSEDWRTFHHAAIARWEQRFDTLVVGVSTRVAETADDYLPWYQERTVRYISNPEDRRHTGDADRFVGSAEAYTALVSDMFILFVDNFILFMNLLTF
jgi:hypothetical protein